MWEGNVATPIPCASLINLVALNLELRYKVDPARAAEISSAATDWAWNNAGGEISSPLTMKASRESI